MSDYSQMSDQQLMATVTGGQPGQSAPSSSDYSKMSDDELMKTIGGSQTQDITTDPSLDLGTTSSQAQETNPNSTGNIGTDIAGDVARGFINSGAGTIDKINGVAKLLQGVTGHDMGTQALSNVSTKLKQMASQQPQSPNPVVSGVSQFIGGIPDALGEFAGTGGGVGFIARSAALQAAQEYNKSQTPTALIKGAAVGGTVGAILDKAPNIIEDAANMMKKWGQTSGKTYLQAVTGANDKEAQEMIDTLPTMDLNPKSVVEDYTEAKKAAGDEIDTLKNNNSKFVDQQKDQFTKEYQSAKTKSDDAVNNLIESNRDTIDDLRQSQSQTREDLAASTSQNMMAATDAATQRLADAATQTTVNTVKAKDALENTFVSTFDTASKKLQTMVKGATDGVANENAFLEKNNLDFAPTSLVKQRVDAAIGGGMGKYFQKLTKTENSVDTLGADKLLDKQVSPGVKVSDLPPEAQAQYMEQASRQGQSNIGQIVRSGNTAESLTAAPGIKSSPVMSAIKLLNDTRKGLVDEFSKSGRTSLIAMNAQSDAIENAINKGFFGAGVPEKLATVLAKVKNAINPTKMFEENPGAVPHLEGLAKANRAYSSQIDGMRNALNLYKDNVDGAINPQKVFSAFEKNDSAYLAKLRQADEALPKDDRIFYKVESAYRNYKKVETAEKYSLTQTQQLVAKQRAGLAQKFDNMRKQLNAEQRQQLLAKIKETRINKRAFSQQESNALKDFQSRQRQALDVMQAQKDKELSALQESLGKRLNSIKLLEMARGERPARTSNNAIAHNVFQYRSIDGMTTLNPLKIITGQIGAHVTSPIGGAQVIKNLLKMPETVQPLKKAVGNTVLKRLLATKLSGR
jgi:hypothetical protein